MGTPTRDSAELIASLAIPLAAVAALVGFVREPPAWQSLVGHAHEHAIGVDEPELGTGVHGGMLAAAGPSLLELVVDERNGTAQLFVSSIEDGRPKPVTPLAAGLRLARSSKAASNEAVEVELLPLPTAGDPAGAASRFVASSERLARTGMTRANVTIATLTRTLRAEFALRSSAGAPVFVCPMRCDDGRAHAEPGLCPRCGMALREIEDAHSDHEPRRGGTLLMAADGFHHVEGVLHTPGEFRLYVYNDFSHPISAARFAGRAEIEWGAPDRAASERAAAPLRGAEGGEYLWLPISENWAMPLEISLRIWFPGRGRADRFDFVFDEPRPSRDQS